MKNRIGYAALYLVFLVATFPAIGHPITAGLDPSWIYGMNRLFADGAAFGRDIFFTYGPLFPLTYAQPVGETITASLVFMTVTHLLLIGALFWLILHERRQGSVAALVGYTALGIFVVNICYESLEIESVILLLIASLILCHRASGRSILIVAAACYTALSFLIKPNMAIFCILFLGPYVLFRLLRKDWKPLAITASFVPAFCVAVWYCLYRDLSFLPGYIAGALQFMQGYPGAMGIGAYAQSRLILLSLIIVAVTALIVKDRAISAITALFMLPAAALLRQSLCRQDDVHTIRFVWFLMTCFFLMIIQRLPARKKIIVCIAAALSLTSFLAAIINPNLVAILTQDSARAFSINKAERISRLWRKHEVRERLLAASREDLRKETLPDSLRNRIGGSAIDAYPANITYMAANNLDWKPRPVFQSYCAYTPWLDGKNATFFAGNSAPHFVIWKAKDALSIDGRYLFNDEPRTVFEIVDRYAPVGRWKDTVLIERRESRAFATARIGPEETHRWGEWIPVPAGTDRLIRAEIRVTRTLRGKLLRSLWKEQPVYIVYRYANGGKKHRLVIDNAPSGVWISPYVTDMGYRLKDAEERPDTDGTLCAGPLCGKAVREIRLTAEDPQAYAPTFTIRWIENKESGAAI